MDDDDEMIFIGLWYFVRMRDRERMERREQNESIRRRRRRWWVHPFLSKRAELGLMTTLIPDLRSEIESEEYNLFAYLRFGPEVFDFLVEKLRDRLTPSHSPRSPIRVDEKLAICLRYLATGTSFTDLMFQYRLHKSTIHNIVTEVCTAIIKVLGPEYMKTPTSSEKWNEVAAGFEKNWQFINCIGCLDGKHIRIRQPARSGSSFWNYKKFFSIVLLAIVDHDYKFLHAEVGINGIVSDGGVFEHSLFKQSMNQLNLPEGKFLIGDGAFPLRSYLLKPYPGQCSPDQEQFNKCLSRARNTVENGFGVMVARNRALLGMLDVNVDLAKLITLSACILHNLFVEKYPRTYLLNDVDSFRQNGDRIDGNWRRIVNRLSSGLTSLVSSGRNETNEGAQLRDYYMNFYASNRPSWDRTGSEN